MQPNSRCLRARPFVALLLAALLTSYAGGACAQEAAKANRSDEATLEQRRAKAKVKYQQGAEAYSAGAYTDAVGYFLEADRLAPSAPLSFNVARSYQNLGDEAGALRWYRDYLRRDPDAQNADEVGAIVSTLSAALAKKGVQQLRVISTPSGATLSIDGRPLGVTPWTGELAPGKHRLTLTLRGYSDVQRELALPARDPMDVSMSMSVSIAPPPGPVLPAEDNRPRFGVLPWVAMGVGAATLGGSLTVEMLRRSAEDDANKEKTQIGYQDKYDTEHSRQTTARVLLGVGGAFVVAGGVMWLVDSSADSKSAGVSAGMMCLPTSCTAAARARF